MENESNARSSGFTSGLGFGDEKALALGLSLGRFTMSVFTVLVGSLT